MKIYVAYAQYCEDTVILGAALDEHTALRIVECEDLCDPKPDYSYYEEFNTDDYIPLNVGLNPYNVYFYPNGSFEVETASLRCFEQNHVYELVHYGRKCLRCQVFALGKQNALRLATILRDKYIGEQ